MREVTERDFRLPEFRDARTEDYEFRADGKIVRKDRWECAAQTIRNIVGIHAREFEIEDVITAVRSLAGQQQNWVTIESTDDLPTSNWKGSVRLEDGSVLNHATLTSEGKWRWRGMEVDIVAAWHDDSDEAPQ